jgi:ABC-type nitrate/sulfonate/bicarbonate transport system substrate-binding protein
MTELRTLRLITFGASPVTAAGTLHGSFEKQGLEIDHTETPNSTEQMRGIGNGKWDIASTAFDNVLAWSGREGAEIVAIATAAAGVVLPVVVRPEINDWEDLRGKPLAVDAIDTAYALVLRRILLEHGLDLDHGDYELVPAGATGYRFESMERGETYAAIMNPPWNERAIKSGMKDFGDHRQVLPNYPGGTYAITRQFGEENRDAVVGFLRGLHDAAEWLHNPATADLAAERLAGENGGDAAQTKARFNRVPKDLGVTAADLQVVLDLRVQCDLMPPMGSDISTYLDTSFLEQALA